MDFSSHCLQRNVDLVTAGSKLHFGFNFFLQSGKNLRKCQNVHWRERIITIVRKKKTIRESIWESENPLLWEILLLSFYLSELRTDSSTTQLPTGVIIYFQFVPTTY